MGLKDHFEARRDFWLIVLNGALFIFAFSFISPGTVLSAFVYQLTGSSLYVGLANALLGVGWFWPQIFISHVVQHRRRKMPFYRLSVFLRVGWMATMTLLTFLLGGTHPRTFFWAFLFLLFLYTSSGGIAMVPWADIVGKVVPPEERAKLFSLRQFYGGILAFLAGFVVKYVLSEESGLSFPYNYGVLFVISTVFVVVGLWAFLLVREPVHPVPERKNSFWEHMTDGPRLLRRDPDYRRYLLARVFWTFGMMGVPFYVPYAIDELGSHPSMAGTFLSVSMASQVLSNLIWGRMGSRGILTAGTLLVSLGALWAGTVKFLPEGAREYGFLLTFVAGGAGVTAINVANIAYLLEIAPSKIRPTYVGFVNTFAAPLTFVPLLAGFLVRYISYPSLFFVSSSFGLASFLTTLTLSKDRASQG
ncbi:MAG: hypothetical protein DRP94_07630 [Candidatus Latescibacterota bacterium]|nr:MAG: hypothetical protein DRP94_07630 [Candidatus Latescibacterota bacterium]RKY73089.1 MAG: hypothetical protein DRQ14_04945 [Candidatus Latescibacterota bacterium]